MIELLLVDAILSLKTVALTVGSLAFAGFSLMWFISFGDIYLSFNERNIAGNTKINRVATKGALIGFFMLLFGAMLPSEETVRLAVSQHEEAQRPAKNR